MLSRSEYVAEVERVRRRNWVTTGFLENFAGEGGDSEALVRSLKYFGVEIIDISTDEGRAAETMLLLAGQGDE
jgi:hypothetical protein